MKVPTMLSFFCGQSLATFGVNTQHLLQNGTHSPAINA